MENNGDKMEEQTNINERILAALEKINTRMVIMEEHNKEFSSRLNILEGEQTLDEEEEEKRESKPHVKESRSTRLNKLAAENKTLSNRHQVQGIKTITQYSLEAYKLLHPDDARLQTLTLDELLAQTNGRSVDYSTITYKPALLGSSEWDCSLGIGYVVFDCICLLLGAASLRPSVTARVAGEMAEAAAPVASKLATYIRTMSAAESSKTEVAKAVFGVVRTLYSGSCLGLVIRVFLGSLTWYNAVLYGATALGTIMGAVATDGAAEIGVLIVGLATAGFLVDDSIKCAKACNY